MMEAIATVEVFLTPAGGVRVLISPALAQCAFLAVRQIAVLRPAISLHFVIRASMRWQQWPEVFLAPVRPESLRDYSAGGARARSLRVMSRPSAARAIDRRANPRLASVQRNSRRDGTDAVR